MNLVFLNGKIISEIEFRFIIESKRMAMIEFLIEVDKNIIKIKAYDEVADYIYSRFNIDDRISIYGSLKKKEVNVIEIEKEINSI